MDRDGSVVYRPERLAENDFFKESVNLSNLEDGVTASGGRIISVKSLPTNDWRVVGVSYLDDITSGKYEGMLEVLALILVFCIGLSAAAVVLLSRGITAPIGELSKAMHQFEENALSFQYEQSEGIREISHLSVSFSHMVERIQTLMKKVKDEEISLRKSELHALQSQINPHFLYNTLDSIQWMCEQGDMDSAVTMVGALAKLFRISISKGNPLIPIKMEIAHAQNYLLIQSVRFEGRFSYRFEVDEDNFAYYCNKITLQPLIENAIIHGFGDVLDEGEIIIRGYETDEFITFEVIDNGVGMTAEQCSDILSQTSSEKYGIGVKNVNNRLKIYFGEEYGLEFVSEPDVGTKVIIRMPKVISPETL
jgi:two-component system sensor histidine kinase YesM